LATPDGELEVDRSGALFFVEEHLRTLAPASRLALTQLSFLGDLELTAPLYLFGEHELASSVRLGFVYKHDQFWRIAHPGYAKLILMAEGADGEAPVGLSNLIERAPELAARVKDRLLLRGEQASARQICATAVGSSEALERQLLYAGIGRFYSSVDYARRSGGVSASALRSRLRKVDPAVVRLACSHADPRSVFRLAVKVENVGSALDVESLRESLFDPLNLNASGAVKEATRRAFREGDFELLANTLSRGHTPETGLEVANGLEGLGRMELPIAVARSRPNHLALLLKSIQKASMSHGKSMPRLAAFMAGLHSDACVRVLREFSLTDAKQAAKLMETLPDKSARALVEALTPQELGEIGAKLAAANTSRYLHKFVSAIGYYAPNRVDEVARGVPPAYAWGRPSRPARPSGAYRHPYEWTSAAIKNPTSEWKRAGFSTVSAALVLAADVSPQQKVHLLQNVIGTATFDGQLAATPIRRRAHLLLEVWAEAPAEVLAWIAKRRILAGTSPVGHADGGTLALLGAASLLGSAIPAYRVRERTAMKAVRRATPGGYRGKSTLLVALGILTTEDTALLDASGATWRAGLHSSIARESSRLAVLDQLLSDWRKRGLPDRQERLEALARTATFEPCRPVHGEDRSALSAARSPTKDE
jgi:hypothetical protein